MMSWDVKCQTVRLGLLFALLHLATGRFSGSPPFNPAEIGVQLDRLYEKTGLVRESPGRSCGELLSMGMTDSGVYWIKPDDVSMPYQAYCDMKSLGGGWQMCYTTKHMAPQMTNEAKLAYNVSRPYKTDGYVSNCKYVPFNQLIFIMHAETRCVDKNMKKCKNFADTSLEGYDDEMAWFTYETTEGEAHNFFTIAGKSGQNLVSPAVQVTYNELAEYKRKYGVWTADKTDSRIGTVAGREQFPGSAVSEAEAYGLWENDQKYDIKTRVTDFWRGRGVAYKVSDNGVVQKDKNWKYEVVVCDESSSVPFGFFVSGMDGNAKGCFKTCNNWCDDRLTDHYRAAWGGCFV